MVQLKFQKASAKSNAHAIAIELQVILVLDSCIFDRFVKNFVFAREFELILCLNMQYCTNVPESRYVIQTRVGVLLQQISFCFVYVDITICAERFNTSHMFTLQTGRKLLWKLTGIKMSMPGDSTSFSVDIGGKGFGRHINRSCDCSFLVCCVSFVAFYRNEQCMYLVILQILHKNAFYVTLVVGDLTYGVKMTGLNWLKIDQWWALVYMIQNMQLV